MSDIEKRLSALSSDKRTLLETMLKRQAASVLRQPAPRLASSTTSDAPCVLPPVPAPKEGMDFSFMFFSDSGGVDSPHKYDLVFQSAKFTDQMGFVPIRVSAGHVHWLGV